MNNDASIILSNAIAAAQEIHIAMCQFDADHKAQGNLNAALQSVLIIAEQCRQMHVVEKIRKLHGNE